MARAADEVQAGSEILRVEIGIARLDGGCRTEIGPPADLDSAGPRASDVEIGVAGEVIDDQVPVVVPEERDFRAGAFSLPS